MSKRFCRYVDKNWLTFDINYSLYMHTSAGWIHSHISCHPRTCLPSNSLTPKSWKAQLSPESLCWWCRAKENHLQLPRERKNLNFSPWKFVNKCERAREIRFYIIRSRAWFRRSAVNQLVSVSLTAHAQSIDARTQIHRWSRESFGSKKRRKTFLVFRVKQKAQFSVGNCWSSGPPTNKQLTTVLCLYLFFSPVAVRAESLLATH